MNELDSRVVLEPDWQPVTQLDAVSLGDTLYSWLVSTGSLTARLKKNCHDFQVKILNEGWQKPFANECNALGITPAELVFVRHVHLCCGDNAAIFARTVIPNASLVGGLSHLTQLGDRPLGELLFSVPGIERGMLEVACFEPQSSFYDTLVGPTNMKVRQTLWGRRSVFVIDHCPLLVSEIFLSDMQGYS